MCGLYLAVLISSITAIFYMGAAFTRRGLNLGYGLHLAVLISSITNLEAASTK